MNELDKPTSTDAAEVADESAPRCLGRYSSEIIKRCAGVNWVCDHINRHHGVPTLIVGACRRRFLINGLGVNHSSKVEVAEVLARVTP